jgi:hypothetical protein
MSLAFMGCGFALLDTRSVPAFHATLKGLSVLHRITRPSSTAIQTPEVDATTNWHVRNLGFRRVLNGTPGLARMVVDRGGFLLAIDKAASDQQPAHEQGVAS